MKKFKEAMVEYKEGCITPSLKWLKRHWKGYCLFVAGCYALGWLIGWLFLKRKDEKEEGPDKDSSSLNFH